MFSKVNTLIILDWDNTLFPTTWITQNAIDVTRIADTQYHNSIINYFTELDESLYNFLSKIIKRNKVIIITNAMKNWVTISSSVLPKTSVLLKSIRIISARSRYQDNYKMDMWKTNCFQDEVEYELRQINPQNIISIGDALYEYNATVNLYINNKNSVKRYLKTIKFVDTPSKEVLIDQINVLNNSIDKIITTRDHVDILFENK